MIDDQSARRAKLLARLDAMQGDDDGDVQIRKDRVDAQRIARDKQRVERAAYDVANPRAKMDAEAAIALEAEIARLQAEGVGGDIIASMAVDLATLQTRNLPQPAQTAPIPAMRRRVVRPWHTAVEMEPATHNALAADGDRIARLHEELNEQTRAEDAALSTLGHFFQDDDGAAAVAVAKKRRHP